MKTTEMKANNLPGCSLKPTWNWHQAAKLFLWRLHIVVVVHTETVRRLRLPPVHGCGGRGLRLHVAPPPGDQGPHVRWHRGGVQRSRGDSSAQQEQIQHLHLTLLSWRIIICFVLNKVKRHQISSAFGLLNSQKSSVRTASSLEVTILKLGSTQNKFPFSDLGELTPKRHCSDHVTQKRKNNSYL